MFQFYKLSFDRKKEESKAGVSIDPMCMYLEGWGCIVFVFVLYCIVFGLWRGWVG